MTKSDFRGPLQSDPKSNPKSNFLTPKKSLLSHFLVKKLLFGLLWGGPRKSPFIGVSETGSAKTGSAIDVRIDDAGSILNSVSAFLFQIV